MATIQDIVGMTTENYKSSGMLNKLLQTGFHIEDDDEDFNIKPREAGS
jgi:hypothetical protein